MSKPLGYYCDSNLFDELVEQYGSTLEGLTRQQKLYLMMSVASHLLLDLGIEEEAEIASQEMTDLILRLRNESRADEKENFLIALANQVRYQH